MANIGGKWNALQAADGERPITIDKHSLEDDIALNLVTSKTHLDAVLDQGSKLMQNKMTFSPNCRARVGWYRGIPSLAHTTNMAEDEVIQRLDRFETWILQRLSSWTEQRLTTVIKKKTRADDCKILAQSAATYRDLALSIYDDSPEHASIIYLTVAEIWYALDRLATKAIPLLREFSPSLDLGLFEPLLVPKKDCMQRLMIIENHISIRHAEAKGKVSPISVQCTEDSFTVHYFWTSSRHKTLRTRIERDAREIRESKKEEWKTSSGTYQQLKDQANNTPCGIIVDPNNKPIHGDEGCRKCALNERADGLTIRVYEDPLPKDHNERICTVFELDCPAEFAAWRNLTWILVQDLGREHQEILGSPMIRLPSHEGLNKYYSSRSRLIMASTVKPLNRQLHFPLPDVKSCYVNSALQYRLFDPKKSCWVDDQIEVPSLQSRCITKLPNGPYSILQYAVDSCRHFQNQVIADQDSCPKDLSLHEFLSFGSLRSEGECIQWLNIRRELLACNLNLNSEAVCILISQAAWQAGSKSDSLLWNSHRLLGDPSFGKELLATIKKVLDSIRVNWMSDWVMTSLVIIILRLFSLCSTPDVSDLTLTLLKDVRLVLLSWTEILENS